jgi:hypothetical protein
MRLTTTLAITAVTVGALSTAATAGGLSPATGDVAVEIIEPTETRSSWGIILPIAAVALLIALAGS